MLERSSILGVPVSVLRPYVWGLHSHDVVARVHSLRRLEGDCFEPALHLASESRLVMFVFDPSALLRAGKLTTNGKLTRAFALSRSP